MPVVLLLGVLSSAKNQLMSASCQCFSGPLTLKRGPALRSDRRLTTPSIFPLLLFRSPPPPSTPKWTPRQLQRRARAGPRLLSPPKPLPAERRPSPSSAHTTPARVPNQTQTTRRARSNPLLKVKVEFLQAESSSSSSCTFCSHTNSLLLFIFFSSTICSLFKQRFPPLRPPHRPRPNHHCDGPSTNRLGL